MEEILDLQEVTLSQTMSDNDLFNYVIDKRNLNEIDYQKDVCCNPLYKNSSKPVAFLQSECSGKTEEMLALLEMFYFRDINKNKKTILNPSALKVTRDNIEDRFTDFKPEFFKFKVAKNSTEYFDLLNTPEQWDVLIITPQLLNSKNDKSGIYNYELLPEIEIYICDEGSDWYFEKVIQRMLKHINPSIQWIFSAQSGKFNLHKDRFTRVFTSTSTLFDMGIISDVKFHVVSTCVDFKSDDFTSNKAGYGELKDGLTDNKKSNIESFKTMIKEMVKVIKIENSNSPISTPTKYNRLTNNYAHVFGLMEQTIIVCNSKPQANDFFNELQTDKKLKGKVLISTEDTDNDSEFLKDFKLGNHLVLIVVYKGRKGYSHNELFNVVDFTYTQDPEMIKNISGRVYRLSKLQPNKQKNYFKVAYKTAAPWYVTVMTGVLALMENGPYQTYNTKNFDGINVPIILNTKEGKKRTNKKRNKRNLSPDFIPAYKPGLSLDMNYFKNVAFYKLDDPYSVITYTTIGDCRRNYFDLLNIWPYKKLDEVYSKYDGKLLIDFIKENPQAYDSSIRNGWHNELVEKHNLIRQFLPNHDKTKLNYIDESKNFDDFKKRDKKLYKTIRQQRDTHGFYDIIIKKFGLEDPNIITYLKDEDKLKLAILRVGKSVTIKEYMNKYKQSYIFLIKKYDPHNSIEGKKTFDSILEPLEKENKLTFDKIFELAKKYNYFSEFTSNYKLYNTNKIQRSWKIRLRIKMDMLTPGWDDGEINDKTFYFRKEGREIIENKFNEFIELGETFVNSKNKTSKFFNVHIEVVNAIIGKEEVDKISYEEHKFHIKQFGFTNNRQYKEYTKKDNFPKNTRVEVENYFKKTGEWEGWQIFLGKVPPINYEDYEDEILKLHNKGLSYDKIAEKLKIYTTGVSKIIKKHKNNI